MKGYEICIQQLVDFPRFKKVLDRLDDRQTCDLSSGFEENSYEAVWPWRAAELERENCICNLRLIRDC